MSDDRHCQQCGMLLDDPGEFHPYVFCVLKKAGRDPWQETRLLVRNLGLGELPQRPPLIRDLPLGDERLREAAMDHPDEASAQDSAAGFVARRFPNGGTHDDAE